MAKIEIPIKVNCFGLEICQEAMRFINSIANSNDYGHCLTCSATIDDAKILTGKIQGMMIDTVTPIMDKQEALEYFDRVIRFWRRKRNTAKKDEYGLIAACYIDAFQSARSSLFGEVLPKDEIKNENIGIEDPPA